jgi:hypothetical protein
MSLSGEMRTKLEEVRCAVSRALDNFCQEDKDLLQRNANERSITHKIAEHLQREFAEYHVDCEYNRRGKEVKRLKTLCCQSVSPDATESVTVYPDIIVHERGKQLNLLVIEAKKSNNRNGQEFDDLKLTEFTGSDEYRYEFGLFLILDITDKCVKQAKWYHRGEDVTAELTE